jgi:hypothetical protein
MSSPKRKLRKPSSATASPEVSTISPDHTEIAQLAYLYWLERGCPTGTAEEDWTRAEQDLKNQRTPTA